MKKLIGIFLAVLLTLSLTTSVFANTDDLGGISAYYLYTNTISINLVIIGNTATCKTIVTGLPSVTGIEATQYLQILSGNTWSNVSGASWNASTTTTRLSMTNEKSGLGKGTYRVYSVATVYSGKNYETLTEYSNSVTI